MFDVAIFKDNSSIPQVVKKLPRIACTAFEKTHRYVDPTCPTKA